jgi:hypothetical protein
VAGPYHHLLGVFQIWHPRNKKLRGCAATADMPRVEHGAHLARQAQKLFIVGTSVQTMPPQNGTNFDESPVNSPVTLMNHLSPHSGHTWQAQRVGRTIK